jgi:hypothetical protein
MDAAGMEALLIESKLFLKGFPEDVLMGDSL